MPPEQSIPAIPSGFTLRALTGEDLDIVCHHRRAMFAEMGLGTDPGTADPDTTNPDTTNPDTTNPDTTNPDSPTSGPPAETTLDASIAAFRPWLAEAIADGRYFGFFAETAHGVAGGVGLMRLPWPPHPYHVTQPDRGYILNVYIEPTARRKGLAAFFIRLAEAEFQRRGIHYLVLHASAAGRPVYEQLGWQSSSEMLKRL